MTKKPSRAKEHWRAKAVGKPQTHNLKLDLQCHHPRGALETTHLLAAVVRLVQVQLLWRWIINFLMSSCHLWVMSHIRTSHSQSSLRIHPSINISSISRFIHFFIHSIHSFLSTCTGTVDHQHPNTRRSEYEPILIEIMPIQHSSYFDSKVQSLASERHGRKFSVGIISAGEHHFGTDAAERMTVVSGMLTAKLDGSDEWIHYPAGTNFEIPSKSGFDVKASTDTAYHCEYL